MSNPFVSVVIPTYNEESRIVDTLNAVVNHLDKKVYAWEIVVADDGSKDNTVWLVEEEARNHSDLHIRLLSLRHKGKGSAVKQGMLYAKGDYRFLADADLSMPILQMDKFLPPELPGCDISIGSRESPNSRRVDEPFLRHLMGRGFNLVVQIIALKGFKDTQCGFKCFKAEAADKIFPLQRSEGFGFDVEVLFLATRMGMNVEEVGVDWYYQEGSKVNPIRDSIFMVRDLLLIRWNHITGKYGKL